MAEPRELIIIAGATRCGTTALFQYLSRHARVGAAFRKETRFFLDSHYPGRSEFRYEAGIDAYWEYFNRVDDTCTHLLEATSDYMFAPGVPGRIKSLVGEPHLIFILRDPVERFVSWYRFARQGAMIPVEASLCEFIGMQEKDEGEIAQHRRVLEQGAYSRYLRRFDSEFPSDRLHVLFLEELAENPFSCLSTLFEKLNLEPSLLSREPFGQANSSYVTKFPQMHRMYTRTWYVLQTRLRGYPTAHRFVRGINRQLVLPLYRMFNRKAGAAADIDITNSAEDAEAMEYLRRYYEDIGDEVYEITGRKPGWNTGRASS